MKRLFDLLATLSILAFLWPLLAFSALVNILLLGFPVYYNATRAGRYGKPFLLYKLRTMRIAKGADGRDLPDEQRLTRWGNFCRKFSIDELPALLNVLRGDMSLVGPRPLLMQYNDRYSPEQKRRLDAVPGITGWAQVNGRNALSWDEKFKLDVWYVDHRSFWLDIKILFMTFFKVIKREGISAKGHATMPEFMGADKPDDRGGVGT